MSAVPVAILIAQGLYALCALLYNLVSLHYVRSDGIGLSANNPRVGIVVMGIYAGAICLGAAGLTLPYVAGVPSAVVVFGYGGIVVHLRNRDRLELYRTPGAWTAAIGINTAGLSINLAALFMVAVPIG